MNRRDLTKFGASLALALVAPLAKSAPPRPLTQAEIRARITAKLPVHVYLDGKEQRYVFDVQFGMGGCRGRDAIQLADLNEQGQCFVRPFLTSRGWEDLIAADWHYGKVECYATRL